MKKINYITAFLLAVTLTAYSQVSSNDFGRIVINTYLSDKLNVPKEARQLLETKLNQMTSNYGMGGSKVNPRFIITANVNLSSKKMIAGPPQMVSQKMDIALFIGDAITNTVFSNTSITLSGVGTNENTAFIDAFNNISTKNKTIEAFITEGKNKIISFYNSQCGLTQIEADALVSQQKYDEAIYKLSLVPEVCEECYAKSLEKIKEIYQQKIDADGELKLQQAKASWLSSKDQNGAKKAFELLVTINPKSKCQPQVNELYKTIETKLNTDEKRQWDLALKIYNNELDVKKSTIKAYRDIAVEYAKIQPQTITYNQIVW